MDVVLGGIFSALKYLIIAYVVYIVWKFADIYSQKKSNKIKVILVGLIISFILSMYSTISMSDLNCIVYDYGVNGERFCVEHDNSKPIKINDQISNFSFVFSLCFVPILTGIYTSSKKDDSPNETTINE